MLPLHQPTTAAAGANVPADAAPPAPTPLEQGWESLLQGVLEERWSPAQAHKLQYYLHSGSLETGGLQVWKTLVATLLPQREEEALLFCLRAARAKVRDAIGLLREWSQEKLAEWDGAVALGTELGLAVAQSPCNPAVCQQVERFIDGAPASELGRMACAQAAPEVFLELLQGPDTELAASGGRLLARVRLNSLSPMAFALAWLRLLAVATLLWSRALARSASERTLRSLLAGLRARRGAARKRAASRFPLELLLADILDELRVPLAEPNVADARRVIAILRAALLQSQPEDFRPIFLDAGALLHSRSLVWPVAAVLLRSPLLLHTFLGLGTPVYQPPLPFELRSQTVLEVLCTGLCAEYPCVKMASEDFAAVWLMLDVLAHCGADPACEWLGEQNAYAAQCMGVRWWRLKARLRTRGLPSPASAVDLLRTIERAARLIVHEPPTEPQRDEPPAAPPAVPQRDEPPATPPAAPRRDGPPAVPGAAASSKPLGSLLRRDQPYLAPSLPGGENPPGPALGALLEAGAGQAWPHGSRGTDGAPAQRETAPDRAPAGRAPSPLQSVLERGKRLRTCNKRLAREQKRLQSEVDRLTSQHETLSRRGQELRAEQADLLGALKGLRRARLGLAADVAAAQATLQRLRQAAEQQEPPRARTCDICEEGPRPLVVFVPCGHARACGECAAGMRECPFCRRDIQTLVVPI
eukprot:g68935.t1